MQAEWMSRIRPLPPPFSGSAFTVASAREAGISRGRLRASDLVAPFYGMRATVSPTSTLREICAAYLPLMSESAHFSHETAALLYGIPLPRNREGSSAVHVTVIAPHHRPRGRGVIGHRVLQATVGELFGLPICSPERAWIGLSQVLAHDDLVVAADHLVRRKHALSTLERMAAQIGEGERGATRLRRVLLDARPGTDSPMETRLRLLLMQAGLPEPIIGQTVIDGDGFFVATPDLSYPQHRIAIEYEGAHHRTDARTFADDILRRELLEDAGWTVIRVIADHFARPAILANRVRRILAEHSLRDETAQIASSPRRSPAI